MKEAFNSDNRLKTETAALYKRWKEGIAKGTHQNADSVITDFYKSNHFQPALQKWTPDYVLHQFSKKTIKSLE